MLGLSGVHEGMLTTILSFDMMSHRVRRRLIKRLIRQQVPHLRAVPRG